LSDDELKALWLRRVETKPADFLRAKFAYQLGRQDAGQENSP
jgi:Ca-activated chloride channel family protein